MDTPILSTKLFIPPIRPGLLPRPQLIKKFEESTSYPLILISASAGSGKTTILSEWVSQNERPTAWVSLDSGDKDPTQFLAYIVSAVQTIDAEFGEGIFEQLQTAQTAPFELLLIELINQIAEFSNNFTLILDDYHTIIDSQIDALVLFLIEHLPPQMQLVISSRIDPPLPLARYRARKQLFEIRGSALRFTAEEVRDFVQRAINLNLPEEEITALEERTEGWIAGLQLVVLSMQGQSDIPAFIQAFTGSHLYIAEYLVEEILNQQPEEIQDFLLKTSILERLNASLCEAVVGSGEGQSTLTLLHRRNAFVVPLDHENQWFRYHHLFADLLQARLSQTLSESEISELHLRASQWYTDNHLPIEAMKHALAGKDFETSAEIIEQFAQKLIYIGRINILRKWLESLPDSMIRERPYLTFYLFWIDLLQGKADFSEKAIQEKEALLSTLPESPKSNQLRGRLMAVVCRAMALSGRTTQAIRMAQDALTFLPEKDTASRSRVNSALAIALELEGRSPEAKAVYERCFSQATSAGDHLLIIHTKMAKGLVQYRTGRLNQAASTFQNIIDLQIRSDFANLGRDGLSPTGKSQENKAFYLAGPGYIGMGHVLLERNQIEKAEKYLHKGIELCREGGLDGIFIARLQLARLYQARGEFEKAERETQFPKDTFSRADDYNVTTRQIMIELEKGELKQAQKLAEPFIQIIEGKARYPRLPLLFHEIVEAVIARVYIAQGKIDKALDLLDKLEETAKAGKRQGRLVEVYMLRATAYLSHDKSTPTPAAVESIKQALSLGQKENYVLIFLEAGDKLIPLIQAVMDQSDTSDEIKKYTQELLKAYAEKGQSQAAPKVPTAKQLVEQLTPREMEVLELIAAGDSNKEIAEKLVVTVRTVKKHTSNIYGKLNVSNRTQASAYARAIGLLPKD